MWKRIFMWTGQGVVQYVAGAAVMSVFTAIGALIDVETLVGCAMVLVVGFCTVFGIKLAHLPRIESMTRAEYDALETLTKIRGRTVYLIRPEKEDKGARE